MWQIISTAMKNLTLSIKSAEMKKCNNQPLLDGCFNLATL